MLYFSKNPRARFGKNNEKNPIPIEAPQTGAPMAHVLIAPNPKIIVIIPTKEAPLAFAEKIFSLIFLTKQVIRRAVVIINTTPMIL